MVVVVAPSEEEDRAAGVVLIREYDVERDREAVENLERICEVGPSGGGGGSGMSLFTDLLGDPLCRVRHSPSFLMLVAEMAIGQENRAIVGIIRGSVKIVTCSTKKARLGARDSDGASPVPIYAKVAYLLGLRVSPFHRHSKGFGSASVRRRWPCLLRGRKCSRCSVPSSARRESSPTTTFESMLRGGRSMGSATTAGFRTDRPSPRPSPTETLSSRLRRGR